MIFYKNNALASVLKYKVLNCKVLNCKGLNCKVLKYIRFSCEVKVKVNNFLEKW